MSIGGINTDNQLISINNHRLLIKEYQGHRVVTFRDIDTIHERPEGTARRNFNENKEHFIENEDCFVRNSSEAKAEYNVIAPNGLTLITESGYLMLVKSLTDDLAWKVQRELVNNYFRQKMQKPACMEDVLIQSLQEMKAMRLQLQETKTVAQEAKQEVQSIRDTISINPRAEWRKQTNIILNKIGMTINDYRTPKDEVYNALKIRGNCRPNILVTNLKARALLQGMAKSKVDELNILDVLENEPRLKEIYVSIVKEMAIKYKVA